MAGGGRDRRVTGGRGPRAQVRAMSQNAKQISQPDTGRAATAGFSRRAPHHQGLARGKDDPGAADQSGYRDDLAASLARHNKTASITVLNPQTRQGPNRNAQLCAAPGFGR
jgi:hypothetical protein